MEKSFYGALKALNSVFSGDLKAACEGCVESVMKNAAYLISSLNDYIFMYQS